MKRVVIIAAVNALALLAYTPLATADWTDRGEPPPATSERTDRGELPPTMHDHWQRGTDWRPGIRERIVSIRKSIHHGVENGQLTSREADRARSELDDTLAALDRMKSDGYLSEHERDRVLERLDAVSRDVWRLRHNERTAG